MRVDLQTQLQVSILSLHRVDPGDSSQVLSLYPLNRRAGLKFWGVLNLLLMFSC